MIHEHGCENCEGGCTGRHNAEERSEEVKAEPYLLLGGALVSLAIMLLDGCSIRIRWFKSLRYCDARQALQKLSKRHFCSL